MEQSMQFFGWVSGAIIVIFLYAIYKVKDLDKLLEIFGSKEGKGILSGIRMAWLLPALVGIVIGFLFYGTEAKSASYFNETVVYVGVEGTIQPSPQCVAVGIDDRLTSNLGLRQNIYRDKQILVNAIYTHHSCALNTDAAPYDAVGLNIEWRLGK